MCVYVREGRVSSPGNFNQKQTEEKNGDGKPNSSVVLGYFLFT